MTLSSVITSCAAEHILSTFTVVHFANNCPNVEDKTIAVVKMQYSQLFILTRYSFLKALFARVTNTVGTFCWSFMDLFVILISIGLSSLFRGLNNELFILKGKVHIFQLESNFVINHLKLQNLPQHFWEQKRYQYRRLCDLCEFVDHSISKITIVSFSNNLFFICVQLLNSMKYILFSSKRTEITCNNHRPFPVRCHHSST